MDPTPSPDAARERLLEMIDASWTTQAIRTACLLELPDRLVGAPQSSAALARSCGCDAAALQRLLNALVTLGVCADAGDDRFALAPLGELLRDDAADSLRAWALIAGGPQWARWAELDISVRSGTSHRRRHEGADGFETLAGESAALFHRAMVELTRRVAREFVAAVDLRGAQRVVDVGGGAGELLATVLAALPQARGVLFDLPHALAVPAAAAGEVAARIERVGGSFFEAVPRGGDAYLLKSVLHNWDDARCAQLLLRCAAAMGDGARLWVLDRVAPQRPGTTARARTIARSDLNMLVACCGRERRLDEFVALADVAGLGLARRTPLPCGFDALEFIACSPAHPETAASSYSTTALG